MGESQTSSKQKLKQTIFEGILKSIDIIVTCHASNCTPRINEKKSNSQYIEISTKELISNVYTAYHLDIYLDVDNNNGLSSVLIERWTFHFDNRKRDTKEARTGLTKRHIGLLMRTLYCFVRLLPSFQFSSQSTNCPLSFRVYPFNSSINEDSFQAKPIRYHFPPIPTNHGYFTLSLNYLDSSSIKNIYSPPRSETIPIPSNNNHNNNNHNNNQHQHNLENHKTPSRRHSTTNTPSSLPFSNEILISGRQSHSDMASTWNTYSGGLRSPTQRSNSLISTTNSSISMNNHDNNNNNTNTNHVNNRNNNSNSNNNNHHHSNNNNNNHVNLNNHIHGHSLINNSDDEVFPNPPELTRNQSRSADSKPNYLLNDQYFGVTRGLDHGRERERSISVDKDRLSFRSGRPPQHPDSSSYSSHGSSPFANNIPAPFYIGGGSYTPSEGTNLLGITEDSPSDVSPPFQAPCGLLSTSPCTGSGSLSVLRDHIINSINNNNNRINNIIKNPPPGLVSVQNLLKEFPESPFDTELFPSNNRDTTRDSEHNYHSSNNNNTDNDGDRNNDIDCIFEYDNDDADDMPFAWSQTPPVDSFLLHLRDIDPLPKKDVPSMTSLQLPLDQPNFTPPPLTGFENMSIEGLKTSSDAFAKLDQLKQYHMNTLIAKS